ncbi:putative membrane protein [Nocardioides daedukensis]|uniref:Putative membrane protein n=1 Tax=Nocardioides daedukensis TaxID=634462 RepID=A0A7Y9UM35_9ACTN|nr:putative membrane protein [Nocardioides daedukensis]
MRPAYIATEFVVATATTGGYSFVSDSVSRLGEIGCSSAYCSPRHELMNGSFIGFGALLAVGAVLLSRHVGPWVTGLLVVSGLSSVATGLAPLDQDATLHAIAATPLFAAQPIALIVLGARLRNDHPRLAGALLGAGVLTSIAAVSFVLSGDGPASGALERLALWPVLVGLAGFAWTRVRPDGGSPTVRPSATSGPCVHARAPD